ncbi:MAG TPA: fasciclin domain-containing protein [Streptosporangiaceae bacterium]|nr:fasciclin domain-containing protein [Streptosporangiaceae bacterium]
MIPNTGPGSFTSLSTQQAVAAVASNPQFSVFVAAIRKAALENRYNSSQAITLFVPENSAFAGLSASDIKLLRTPGEVQKIIKYHVVASRITPEQISAGGRVTTLEGGSIELSKAGSDYLVGGATVLCGNIATANATIYIINKVLLPPR